MRIFVAYFPVIHAGHLKIFSEQAFGEVVVLNRDFLVEQFPDLHLERDLRACPSGIILLMFKGLHYPAFIIQLASDLERFIKKHQEDTFVFPDEELSHRLTEKFSFPGAVEFRPVWLRWERKVLLENTLEPAERKALPGEISEEVIRMAESAGGKSSDWWRQVGACVWRGGKLMMWAWNEHKPTEYSPYINGDPRSNLNAGERIDLCTAIHAEASIIASAARQGISLEGSSMFVTTFPCPACARLIVGAGIKEVFFKEGYSLLDAGAILKLSGVGIAKVNPVI